MVRPVIGGSEVALSAEQCTTRHGPLSWQPGAKGLQRKSWHQSAVKIRRLPRPMGFVLGHKALGFPGLPVRGTPLLTIWSALWLSLVEFIILPEWFTTSIVKQGSFGRRALVEWNSSTTWSSWIVFRNMGTFIFETGIRENIIYFLWNAALTVTVCTQTSLD